jgi:hypothetical protein
MANIRIQSLVAGVALCAAAGTSSAQICVLSDQHGNTGCGTATLVSDSNDNNTAIGDGALHSNTNGGHNTASGAAALYVNSAGTANVADGYQALYSNTTGVGNAAMGANTAKLAQLRPVTFRLRTDRKGTVQYGLIAEEVARVYPELAIRDENGRIDGVRYDELAPMLLNEMQKEQATVATLVAQHEADAAKIAMLAQQLAGIQAALARR